MPFSMFCKFSPPKQILVWRMSGEWCPLLSFGKKCYLWKPNAISYSFCNCNWIRDFVSRIAKGLSAVKGQQLNKGEGAILFKVATQTVHMVFHMCLYATLLGKCTLPRAMDTPCDCNLYGKILLPLQWCCAALHPFPHSLPDGNQIASLTTNDQRRHIFWCHLVLSFLAFILMWLVAQEPPVCGWQIMGSKTLVEEKRTRDREEKKLGMIWKSSGTEQKISCLYVSKEWKSWQERTKIHKSHHPAL